MLCGAKLTGPVRAGSRRQPLHRMRIIRARHLGFCFGVRAAIELARQQARQGPVTLLGQLVHNSTVQAELRAQGIETRQSPGEVETPVVMVSAHGASEKMIGALKGRGMTVVDAACPLVDRVRQRIKELVAAGFHPVIVGVRDHPEVRGLTEDLAECDVVLSEEDAAGLRERARFGVVSQTTQPVDRSRRMAARIQERFPGAEVRWVDTVCQPTKDRQAAAEELGRECTVVVVVGGARSNNTRELAAASRRYCARVHWVETAAELHPDWFGPDDTVGITAGASTPDAVIDEVEAAAARIGAMQRAALRVAA